MENYGVTWGHLNILMPSIHPRQFKCESPGVDPCTHQYSLRSVGALNLRIVSAVKIRQSSWLKMVEEGVKDTFLVTLNSVSKPSRACVGGGGRKGTGSKEEQGCLRFWRSMHAFNIYPVKFVNWQDARANECGPIPQRDWYLEGRKALPEQSAGMSCWRF